MLCAILRGVLKLARSTSRFAALSSSEARAALAPTQVQRQAYQKKLTAELAVFGNLIPIGQRMYYYQITQSFAAFFDSSLAQRH